MDFFRKWNGNEAIKTKRHCLLWQSGTFDKSQLSEPIAVPAGCSTSKLNRFLFGLIVVELLLQTKFGAR